MGRENMKSQDVVLLFKLLSLEAKERTQKSRLQEREVRESEARAYTSGWEGWTDDVPVEPAVHDESYSMRALAGSLSISKTEVSAALKRCNEAGLAFLDPRTGVPRANARALLAIAQGGLRYFFPVRPAEVVRGIPTAFSAPVLSEKLMTAGDFLPVWPDPHGKTKGQAIAPLFRSVPAAVKKDPALYEFLALVDAIRIGNPREVKLAASLLEERMLPR